MDCTDIKSIFERDVTEYTWYCFCWHNSAWMDLSEYCNIAKNNNHLLRTYLSKWDYFNERNNLCRMIKNIENDDSGIPKNKKLLDEYKSKLMKINAIQFTFNAFSINVSSFNKQLFKKYNVQKKKKGKRILLNDILQEKNNSTSSEYIGISVSNAIPAKIYDKVLSLNYILKIPLDKKVKDDTVTNWLKWLIFESPDLSDVEEVLYFWIIDYIFKISLVIDISKSYNTILALIKKDESLNKIQKESFIKDINDNEEYILKQFTKFAQLPFGRTVEYYAQYEAKKLFEDLKSEYLKSTIQKIEISNITGDIFLNFSNEIDGIIDYIKNSYEASDIKITNEVGFDTLSTLEKILKQIDIVYNSIIHSHVNHNKIINSNDVRIAIGKLESEVIKELNSVSIIKDQLIKEIENLKTEILNNVDFCQKTHNPTNKLYDIFNKSKKACCNIIFSMHSMELAIGLKEIMNKNYNDESILLKEKVQNYFGISVKNEKLLEKNDVKIFTYLYNYINKWGLFMPII
ncbi:hypothetical protein ACOAOT_22215 [Lacrimispora sp. AGF001]|uniref:hypothetical protein n=1 Tax=Lacrimispora sp. AGF001 TaxID=3401631 RepID=UPI003B43972E